MAHKRLKLIGLRGTRTQREIAGALGITTSYYGMIELGARTPNLALAKKIEDFFGVPMREIFFEGDNNKTLSYDKKQNPNRAVS